MYGGAGDTLAFQASSDLGEAINGGDIEAYKAASKYHIGDQIEVVEVAVVE
jgi:hypothetical protein